MAAKQKGRRSLLLDERLENSEWGRRIRDEVQLKEVREGAWDEANKQTFTRWVNARLAAAQAPLRSDIRVHDLFEEMKVGQKGKRALTQLHRLHQEHPEKVLLEMTLPMGDTPARWSFPVNLLYSLWPLLISACDAGGRLNALLVVGGDPPVPTTVTTGAVTTYTLIIMRR